MHRKLASAGVAVMLLIAALSGGVVAQEENSVVGDLLDGEDDGLIESVQAYAGGFIDRVLAEETDETAAEAAQRTQETFNGNASTIQAWVNNRTSASDAYDVLAFTFEIGDEASTVYLTSNATADGYQNASMVDTTDRTSTSPARLQDHAARGADAELATFVDEHAEPGENVTNSYLAGLAGEYGGDVDCTFSTETEGDDA